MPNNSNAASLLSGKTVTVKATINADDGSSTTCSFQAIASSSGSSSAYQMSWGSMAAASLVLAVAYGIRRRRRSMAQIDLDAAEDQLPSSDFELMKSSPTSHVVMA
jgi:cytochrome oxidase assembly protein ShyY1